MSSLQKVSNLWLTCFFFFLQCQKYKNRVTHTQTHTALHSAMSEPVAMLVESTGCAESWYKTTSGKYSTSENNGWVWDEYCRKRNPKTSPGSGYHRSHEAGLRCCRVGSVCRPHVRHARLDSASCLFWFGLVLVSGSLPVCFLPLVSVLDGWMEHIKH